MKTITEAIDYVIKFNNMKYVLANYTDLEMKDGPPFWNTNTPPPSIDHVKKYGSCCTGLPNLVRRYLGLEIPGNITGYKKNICIGGTDAWFSYLKSKNMLQKIDINKDYPKGTLLLQNYNKNDQGHLSITINSNIKGLQFSDIIHNINGTWNNKKYNSVVIEKFIEYPYKERYTHISLPENWLLIN